MPRDEAQTSSQISMFCLHFLGGSARSWDAVAASVDSSIACISFDLPGFGDESIKPGLSVAAMADLIAGRIKAAAAPRWWIAGHSMGAKIALAIARRAESGMPGLAGLQGVVLVAGSPPGPEPMKAEKRAELLSWVDKADRMRSESARKYIRDNVGEQLHPDVENRAVADVLRTNPDAWGAWLTEGSREDWREKIGILSSPALILSGSNDQALGPDAQQRLMMPHLKNAQHIAVGGAGHLLPIERPEMVSRHLCDAILS